MRGELAQGTKKDIILSAGNTASQSHFTRILKAMTSFWTTG